MKKASVEEESERLLTERLVDGKEGFNDKHGRSHDLWLLEHVSSFPVQHAVDAADHLLWALCVWERDAGEKLNHIVMEYMLASFIIW